MPDTAACFRLHVKVLAAEGCVVVALLVYLATREPFGLFLESPDLRPFLGVVLVGGASLAAMASTLVMALVARRLRPGWAVLVSRLALLAGVALALVALLVR